MAAHEAGHLLGLPDHYKDVNGGSVPDPGFENDIMGARGKAPSERDIQDIIGNCGCATSP